MAPKNPTSEAPPSSRRSARIADQPKSTATTAPANGEKKEVISKKESTTKKRSAEETNGEEAELKKPKADTTSKASATEANSKTTSKGHPTSKKETAKSAKSASEKEKEEEAPAQAEADTGSKGALKKGDKLPKITLQDNKGDKVDVSQLAGEKGVVIFLYPKADTPGCTTQACGYRDSYDEIQELGYDIYGLSKDKSEAQQKWINKKQLTYRLLCDPESKLIKRLGAFVQPNNTKRSHFIFEKGSGKLVDIALGVKPADDPSNVLKFLKKHQTESD